jgi:hypothetical protein
MLIAMTDAARHERRLELVTTILLALATVATAWAAYQSRQWTGQQSESTAIRRCSSPGSARRCTPCGRGPSSSAWVPWPFSEA